MHRNLFPSRWPPIRVEWLALVAALYFSLIASRQLWSAMLTPPPDGPGAGPALMSAMFVAVTALQFALLAVLMNRWSAKPLLALLLIASAFAAHFIARYGIYLSPSMLRNVFQTDPREAGELMNARLFAEVALTGLLPAAIVCRLRLRRDPFPRSILIRIAAVLSALVLAALAIAADAGAFSSVTREHRALRYLITPGNFLYGIARVGLANTRAATRERAQIAPDISRGPEVLGQRPRLWVIVIGETVRAMNWGLNGYERQTTPRLAQIDGLLNYPDVQSCGTDTATSVPCMFSAQGRRHYDEDAILSSESLLHAVARAGVRVLWRDNQGGCKGVCAGLEEQRADMIAALDPRDARGQALCHDNDCLDEALLSGLDTLFASNRSDLLLVLHPLGNHGPAYFRRYPPAFRHYVPACESANLGECTDLEIRNAYDNAILYTDDWLARLIMLLEHQHARYDAGMIYISDHGESLGEKGLYLHGIPRMFAPDEQTHVPMIMWLSPQLRAASGIDAGCMRERARKSAEHDHLFNTTIAMLGLHTSLYDPAWDLAAPCRGRNARIR